MNSTTLDWFVPGGMFLLMFGMGLALSRADFERVLVYPRATVLGTFLQLVAMPLAGIAVALAFGLPPLLAAGLVIVAACPGGTMSNLIVYLAKADTALSITLTATATLATLFTLPLWVSAILALESGVSTQIEVPVLDTALRLGAFTILPVILGMTLRPRLADPAAWERRFSRVGVVVMVGALIVQGILEDEESFAGFEQSLLPALCVLGIAFFLGYGVPLLWRVPAHQAATIGVEICLKNTVLGIFLATQSLAIEAAVPIAAYMAFQLPACVAIVLSFRWLERRQLARNAALPAQP